MECYRQVAASKTACSPESLDLHEHTTACLDENGVYTCGYSDFIVHKHDAACYDESGNLWCTFPEIEAHTHEESCYAQNSELPDELELVCDKKEIVLHEHTDECFDEDDNLICDKTQILEHIHSGACLQTEEEAINSTSLTCTFPEDENHTHSELCYGTWFLTCELSEHVHSRECYTAPELEGTEVDRDGLALINASQNGTAQTLPVTAITGSGTTYDPTTGFYTSDLKISFAFNDASSVKSGISYVFSYPKSILVPAGLLDTPKVLYDSSGARAGTYTFVANGNGTYSVQVKFDQDYLDTARETITGHVAFAGTLDATADAGGNIKIPIGVGDLTINIPPEEITYPSGETDRYDMEAEKQGGYVTNGNKLVYTVYVRSRKGTPNPINFHDVLTANGLTLGKPTVTVEQGTYNYYSQWDKRYNNDWKTVSVSSTCQNGEISMNLPGLPEGAKADNYTKGNCYRITYTYDLGDQKITQATAKNKVKVTAEDKKTKQTVEDEKSRDITIDKRITLQKSGAYSPSTGKINWTITINNNHADVANAKLTDEMLKQLAGASDLQISVDPGTGGYKVNTKSGKITDITFEPVNGGANTNKYTIKYSTTAPEEEWNSQQVPNTAELDPTPNGPDSGDEIPTGSTVNIPGGSVGKKFNSASVSADETSATVNWTVTVNVPAGGLPKGAVIQESTADNHWMTYDQVLAWAKGWKWDSGGTVTVPLAQGTFQTTDGQKVSYSQLKKDGKYKVVEVSFPNGLTPPGGKEGKLVFTYNTTADLAAAKTGDNTYRNTITVANKSQSANYVYRKGGVVKTDGSGREGSSKTQSEGVLSWRIKVTMDNKDNKSLTVTDKLPAGVALDGIAVSGNGANMSLTIGSDGAISGSDNTYQVSGRFDSAKNEVVLTMTPKTAGSILRKGGEYVFTVTAHADGEKLADYAPGKTYTFTNETFVTTDEGDYGSSTQTQEWTYYKPVVEVKKLTKSGSWDNDNRRLDYSILINPEGKDLVAGTDSLTLIDDLKYQSRVSFYWPDRYDASMEAALIQGSVKLYKAVQDAQGGWRKGTEVNDWKWVCTATRSGDQVTSTITAERIPDSTPLIMEYAYTLSSTVHKGDSCSIPVSNSARLEGLQETGTDNRTQDNWKDQSSSAAVTTEKSYTFYKVEKGNYNRSLSGAVFSVYQYNASSGTYAAAPERTYTTDEKGMFQIEMEEKEGDTVVHTYLYNTLYKVVEVTPPEGYLLPDPVTEYYFYFSNEKDTAHTLPANLPSSAVDLTTTAHTVYAENIRNTTELTVKKVWKDYKGDVVTHNGGSVTLDVYQKVENSSSSGGGSNDGTATLTGTVKYGSEYGNPWLEFNETYPAGTKLTFTFTCKHGSQKYMTLFFNGASLSPEKTEKIVVNEGGWRRDGWIYTYSIVLQGGENVLKGWETTWNQQWGWSGFTATVPSAPTPGENEPPEDALVRTVTISATDEWQYKFEDLPLTATAEDGSVIHYVYYVTEREVPNYTTTYENNGGITNGTIQVINRSQEFPGHRLPETGGAGTTPYTIGGVLTLCASALLLYNNKKRRKGDGYSPDA